MAYRYLIYSTGTTYSGTIVRESAINDPGVNEASFYTNFAIPEIQPLYLWQVDNVGAPTTLIPNSDSNVSNYEDAIAPPPEANDLVVYSELTGATANKIDKVIGQTDKIPVFTSTGNLQSGGYTIPELTGLTTYTFVGSGGTTVNKVGNTVTINSAVPTGTTVSWGTITGNIYLQTDLQNEFDTKQSVSGFTYYTGTTAPATYLTKSAFNTFSGTTLPANYYNKTEINAYTGATATAIGNKLNTSVFNTFTGTTLPANYLSKSVFNSYTGTTQPILNSALTGVTNLGTGTTLGGVSARNVTLKSISVIGGLSIVGDANNLIISGQTTAPTTWGNISGTLSNQTDLWAVLTGKTDNTIFNYYTGTTAPLAYASRSAFLTFTGVTAPATYETIVNFNLFTGTTLPANYYNKSQINTFTGTTLPANYYNKTQINAYTGQTQTLINSKVAKVTGATLGNIVTFASGGEIQDSGKVFTTTVQSQGLATNNNVPTELAVRNAINQAVAAAIILQGDWNANTNTPDLTVTGITTGFAWRVSVSGTTDLGGISTWYVGDMAVKSATGWIRIANVDVSAIWGNITGNILNQTDLQNQFGTKQNTITGAATSITGNNLTINRALISDALGKVAVSPVSSTELSYLTGATSNIQTQINSKLNTSIFTGYTASTASNEIFLIHTGGTDVNTVAATPIPWHTQVISGSNYTWSGGTNIKILTAGNYEVTYNIPFGHSGTNNVRGVGSNIVVNGATIINQTASAGATSRSGMIGSLNLATVVLTFAANDIITLIGFRTGLAGISNSVSSGSILIKKKNTIQ